MWRKENHWEKMCKKKINCSNEISHKQNKQYLNSWKIQTTLMCAWKLSSVKSRRETKYWREATMKWWIKTKLQKFHGFFFHLFCIGDTIKLQKLNKNELKTLTIKECVLKFTLSSVECTPQFEWMKISFVRFSISNKCVFDDKYKNKNRFL